MSHGSAVVSLTVSHFYNDSMEEARHMHVFTRGVPVPSVMILPASGETMNTVVNVERWHVRRLRDPMTDPTRAESLVVGLVGLFVLLSKLAISDEVFAFANFSRYGWFLGIFINQQVKVGTVGSDLFARTYNRNKM